MANPLHIKQIPQRYKALEYLQMPVALVDTSYNLLYFNRAFSEMIQGIDSVFPPKDLTEIFVDFTNRVAVSIESTQNTSQFEFKNLLHCENGNLYDLYLSLIDEKLDHIEGYSVTCILIPKQERQLQTITELSEHHLRLLEYTHNGVMIHRNEIIVYSNERADQIAGLRKGETLVGKKIWTFFPKEFEQIVASRIRELHNNLKITIPIEVKMYNKDGNYLDVEVFVFPVQYEGKYSIKTIITDITERKIAEKKLIESRKQYFTLVENLSDVIFQTDTDARFCYLNSSWLRLTGFSIEDTIGVSCFEFLAHPQNTDLFYQKVRKLLEYGIQEFQYDLLLKTKDNQTIYVEVGLKPIVDEDNKVVGINGIIRDIHSKKIASIEVNKIQKTLKNHQSVLVSLTKEESIISGNLTEALKRIAEITVNTLQVNRISIREFSQDKKQLIGHFNYDNKTNLFSEIISLDKDTFPHYFEILLKDRLIISDDAQHDHRLEELRASYLEPEDIVSVMQIAYGSNENLLGILSIESSKNFHKWTLEDQSFARAIADFISLAYKGNLLKRTRNELLESENLYRTLVEQATDAIIMINVDDMFIEVNNKMCIMTGYTRQELLNMRVEQLIPQRFLEKSEIEIDDSKTRNRFFGERNFIVKSGELRIAELSASRLRDGRILGIARDITDRKKQEQALIDSEARLEMALKGADLGTWDFYIEENKMVHNKRWAEMLGYFFENTVVTQQFWEKFVHPDDTEAAYKAFQDHVTGKTPFYEATIRMLASNGEWKWILDKGKVVEWDNVGNPKRASGIHQDITELRIYQQQLFNQKKFLQEIVNAIPNLIYVKNINDEFVTVNNALVEFLGTTSEELLRYKRHKSHEYTELLNKLFEKDFDVFINKKPVVVAEQQITNVFTGKTYWVQSIKLPLVDDEGNFSEILSVSMNVTEIKNKEHELSNLNDKLEQKVIERTSLLESANKELETFNYSVSHDLRTPLRSIDIFAYFLEKNYRPLLDKDGIENIRQIRLSITKMGELIDNLLIFSKIGRSDKKADIIQTKALIEELIEENKTKDELNHYKFIIRDLPELTGDHAMLKQAFVNLLSNAIKFSKVRKRPVIEFFGTEDEISVTIHIKDNGVGFNMEFKDKLFKALKRLHSDEHFDGSGIGLAIVERIIKRHNGSIWAESTEEKGTTFSFSIPKE